MRTDAEKHTDSVIRRTRAAMTLERFLRAFWPFACFLGVFWSVLAFDVLSGIGHVYLQTGLAGAALLALGLLVRGARSFRIPAVAEAREKIDKGLPGRPLAALGDFPATSVADPAAAAVWSAHLNRMYSLAKSAKHIPADLRLSGHDRWGLRLMALVVVIAALMFARSDGIETLSAAISDRPDNVTATGPVYEGWARPPDYTGLPVIYLPEVEGTGISVLSGTLITLRAYGEASSFELVEDVSSSGSEQPGSSLESAAPGIAGAEFVTRQSGQLSLAQDGNTIGQWAVGVFADAIPEIAVADQIGTSQAGEMQLPWAATDDYGVVSARAEIQLDTGSVTREFGRINDPDPRPALVVDLPLPISGGLTEISETFVRDLSDHVWSGLPVIITLFAEDAAGQSGVSEKIQTTLPGRRFYNPVAAALAEQRRDLLWSAANGRRVVHILKAVTHRPDDLFENPSAYLITRTAMRRLESAVRGDFVAQMRDEAADALWKAALLLEQGSLGDAAEQLARAQERLREALRSGADDDEIAGLMDELRQATRNYMEQLARDAIRQGDSESAEAPQPGQSLSQDQINELMNRIQELSEQGRRAEAEALLEMLQGLLENLETRLTEGGGGPGGQGQQSQESLGDALRQQQGLADESFQQLQRRFRDGSPGSDGESERLADRQDSLSDLVEGLGNGLPDEAGDGAREALRGARRSMREAGRQLRDGDFSGALDSQAEAIDRLREGMSELGQDRRRAEGRPDRNGSNGTDGEGGQSTDPLGRPSGAMGSVGTDGEIPGGPDAAARARSILDEIRRRSGEFYRPQQELDYLRRLLDRF